MRNPINRMRCLELATRLANPRQGLAEAAEVFCRFGQDDELRLAALDLAMATVGRQGRISSDGVVQAAQEYLAIALNQPKGQPQPAAEPAPEKKGKRGRRR